MTVDCRYTARYRHPIPVQWSRDSSSYRFTRSDRAFAVCLRFV